jgi:hypothetical protein
MRPIDPIPVPLACAAAKIPSRTVRNGPAAMIQVIAARAQDRLCWFRLPRLTGPVTVASPAPGRTAMNRRTRAFILELLRGHNTMSLATVRSDGYPQATTVAYANDGLKLVFACDGSSQKVRNIKRSRKVSLTIDRDYKDWSKIRGLSMGGLARVLTQRRDIARGLKLLARKFPAMADLSPEDLEGMAVVEVTPKVISVLDYRKGFGHTELVKV